MLFSSNMDSFQHVLRHSYFVLSALSYMKYFSSKKSKPNYYMLKKCIYYDSLAMYRIKGSCAIHLTSLQQQPVNCKLIHFAEQNPIASFTTLNFFLRDIYKTDNRYCILFCYMNTHFMQTINSKNSFLR